MCEESGEEAQEAEGAMRRSTSEAWDVKIDGKAYRFSTLTEFSQLNDTPGTHRGVEFRDVPGTLSRLSARASGPEIEAWANAGRKRIQASARRSAEGDDSQTTLFGDALTDPES